ncbi:MAG TPA: hypothetical protein VF060_08020 [Trebonia sp.]
MRRRWSSVREAVRHWPMGTLLAGGVALRAAATVAYRSALVYIDTPRYLGHDERGLDPLGYRYLMLKPLLALHAGLTGVAIAQHLLGLALGIGIYALVLKRGAPRILAAIAAAPVLLDAYQVQAEQLIMPDVLFEVLLFAAAMLILWPAEEVRTGARVAGAALILGIAATVRQVGELAVIPLAGYALAVPAQYQLRRAGGGRAEAAPTRTATARGAGVLTALGVFALPVVAYMTLSAAVLGTGFRLSNMDDAYLYARFAHAADCATLRVPGEERALCPTAKPSVDDLATAADSPLYRYGNGALVARFDEAVLAQQPLRVAADVTRDAATLFALTRDTAQIARWQFQPAYPVYQAADRAVLGTGVPRADPALSAALRWYQLHGGFTPGPLLLAFLISGTVSAVSPRTPRSLRLTTAVGVAFALATVGGADLYEFSWRYQLPALVTLPAAGVLGAMALVKGGVTSRSPGKGRMNRCIRNRLTSPSPRSGRWTVASSTPTPGSGSARTKSSAAMDPAARTPSSNGMTSP